MAYSNSPAAANTSFNKADAFLNLVIKHGDKEYRLRKGVPLHLENLIEKSLIEAHKGGEGFTVELVGTVQLANVELNDDDLIDFS